MHILVLVLILCLQPIFFFIESSATSVPGDKISVPLGEPFELAFEKTAYIESADLLVRFFNVTEDSRCPADVQCIWAGQVTVVIEVKQNTTNAPLGNFSLTRTGGSILETPTVGGYDVLLVRVDPYPISTRTLQLSDYAITLLIDSSSAGYIIRGGAYVSPYGDLEIQLPKGWSGLDSLGVVMISPDGLKAWKHPISMEAAMIIYELEGTEMFAYSGAAIQEGLHDSLIQNSLLISKCERQGYTFMMINGTEVLQGIAECTSNEGQYSKTKTYAIMVGERVATITFSANSSQSYEKFEPVFDESISTIRVDDSVGIKEGMAEALGLESSNYQVLARDNNIELDIQSNSNVSNFRFDEAAKQILFDVEGGNGTNGFAIVSADSVLEPPYTITIDGQPTTHFFIFEDKVNGENTVQINYQHSSHHVAITGTSVVPEFNGAYPLLIAISILATMIISRNLIGRISPR